MNVAARGVRMTREGHEANMRREFEAARIALRSVESSIEAGEIPNAAYVRALVAAAGDLHSHVVALGTLQQLQYIEDEEI